MGERWKQRDHLSGDLGVWVVKYKKVVKFWLYFKGRAASIHDILDMGWEKMREFLEFFQFILC